MTTDEKIKTQLAASTEATQVVSRKTAAKLLDCHTSFVDRLCSRGELDTITLGPHCKRITLTSLNRLISRAATPAT